MRKLFLASTSPRRRALLEAEGIEFELVEPGPEPAGTGAPLELCVQRARSKALLARGHPRDACVLGVDTVVEQDGGELDKPVDRARARATILRLSGRSHVVHTAHCLVVHPAGRMLERVTSAKVSCRALSEGEIERYLDTGEWTDKAGGYGIQGAARAFMTLEEGELDTVVGLSISAVRTLLKQAGRERPSP